MGTASTLALVTRTLFHETDSSSVDWSTNPHAPYPRRRRSQIVFEVKPWDTETDLKELFAKITSVRGL